MRSRRRRLARRCPRVPAHLTPGQARKAAAVRDRARALTTLVGFCFVASEGQYSRSSHAATHGCTRLASVSCSQTIVHMAGITHAHVVRVGRSSNTPRIRHGIRSPPLTL